MTPGRCRRRVPAGSAPALSPARSRSWFPINGDFVDFAQIEPLSVEGLPSWLLWDETASLTKLEASMGDHPLVFDALADFWLYVVVPIRRSR